MRSIMSYSFKLSLTMLPVSMASMLFGFFLAPLGEVMRFLSDVFAISFFLFVATGFIGLVIFIWNEL